MKIFVLHPVNVNNDLFDDPEVAKLFVIRAPNEQVARELPQRDDSWAFNGGKSPWQNPELTRCIGVETVEIPVNPANGQKYAPEEYTKILYTFFK